MRIGESDDVTSAGINLPVAAKRILPLKLRAAMHVEDERILLGRVEIVWLDDEDFNLRSVLLSPKCAPPDGCPLHWQLRR